MQGCGAASKLHCLLFLCPRTGGVQYSPCILACTVGVGGIGMCCSWAAAPSCSCASIAS